MATTKIGRPGSRERRGATSALNAPRRRVHALAPEHVGELGSIAALAVSVLGVAVLIVGVTLIVQGITIGSRYDAGANGPPPDLAQLGRLPLLGGAGLLVLGILMTAAPLALLADVRFSRVATILLALIGGGLAVLGLLAVISRPGGDPVATASLGLTALILGASALILARPGR
ncbi:MAG: hypothetical protein E6I62_03225 [Chloroflexi bacterium]|nr:MAG: hypothetical protein E6I62_03225 [Chloroflexota bacterium]